MCDINYLSLMINVLTYIRSPSMGSACPVDIRRCEQKAMVVSVVLTRGVCNVQEVE